MVTLATEKATRKPPATAFGDVTVNVNVVVPLLPSATDALPIVSVLVSLLVIVPVPMAPVTTLVGNLTSGLGGALPGSGTGGTNPGFFNSNAYQLANDVDWLLGKHQVSFGANWIHTNITTVNNRPSNGQFTFNGQGTGLGLADFMLGRLSNFDQGNPNETTLQHLDPAPGQTAGGFAETVQNIELVGSRVVDHIVANWATWQAGVPKP